MNFRKYAGIILNILVPLFTVYLVCVWGLRLVVFFLPFVIGWIVAAIANPVVRFFEKRLKIVRRHGSMVLIAGVLALVIFGIYALFSWVFRETTEFGQALPGIYASIREEVDLACERIGGLLKYLPADTEMTIVSELENVGGYIGDFVQKIAASAGSRVVRTLPEVFVNTIIVFLSSYLFLADHDKLVETVRKVMPEPVIKYGRMMKNDIRTLIGGYFLAQFKIMFVVWLILGAGFFILGVSYGPLWALLIALLDFLPVFGTGTALIPWGLIKILGGEYAFAAGLILIYILTQVIRQLVQPKLVGDTLGLNPLLTLFLLYLGFKIKGLAGMILAVPLGLFAASLYRFGAFDSMLGSMKELAGEINRFRGKTDR